MPNLLTLGDRCLECEKIGRLRGGRAAGEYLLNPLTPMSGRFARWTTVGIFYTCGLPLTS
jgi:hypothetical protein